MKNVQSNFEAIKRLFKLKISTTNYWEKKAYYLPTDNIFNISSLTIDDTFGIEWLNPDEKSILITDL